MRFELLVNLAIHSRAPKYIRHPRPERHFTPPSARD
jgi:hypothetical protein